MPFCRIPINDDGKNFEKSPNIDTKSIRLNFLEHVC